MTTPSPRKLTRSTKLVVATHNERLAYRMDRVVRLHEGKLE